MVLFSRRGRRTFSRDASSSSTVGGNHPALSELAVSTAAQALKQGPASEFSPMCSLDLMLVVNVDPHILSRCLCVKCGLSVAWVFWSQIPLSHMNRYNRCLDLRSGATADDPSYRAQQQPLWWQEGYFQKSSSGLAVA